MPVKIESEDTAVAEILNTAPIDEDENATFNFRISPATLPVGQVVRVYYGVTEATTSATEGEDYTLPEMNYVTFSSSKATAQVTIPIINDKIFEGDETLGLILLSSDHPDIEYMGGRETITIRDNDQVTVDFIGPDSYTVNEGDGSVAVTFGITAGTLAANATVAVSYATSADTAFEADDYTPVAGTVILTADNPEVTVWIPITNDTTPEGDERFTFIISPPTDFGGVSSADITITDDDPLGTIGFALDYYEGKEFINGNAVPQVRVSPLLADTFTLNYVIESGTATAGEDYTSMTMGTVELRPGVLFNSLEIEILVDDIQEGIENFFVRLALPDGASLPPGYSFSETRTEVGILDDEAAQIGFIETSRRFDELYVSGGSVNDPVIAIGVELEELGETVTLHYVIENGSATFGEDYGSASTFIINSILTPRASGFTIEPGIGPTTGTITLYPGTVQPGSYGIVVPLMDDNLVENDETFTIRLFEPPGGLRDVDGNELNYVELYNDTYEVTIQNDDDVEIDFNDSSPSPVYEDRGEALVAIAVQSSPRFADNATVTVGYEIRGGSALVGQDYTGTDGTLIFAKTGSIDQPFVNLRIPIIDDDLFELNSAGFNEETFTVTIFNLNEPPISGLSFRSTEFEVAIIDNDLPDITLRSETGQWIEGMAGTLRASIPDPLAVDLELTIIPVFDDMDPDTVDADDGDYRGASTVTIPAGDRSVVIEASIHDDNTVEVDKVLNVTVSQFNHIGLANPHVYQLAARPSASITIVDDDPLTLNLEVQESNQEADTVQATVKFVTTSSFEFTGKDRPQVVTLELRDANGELFTGRIDGQDIGGMGRQSYYGSPIPFTPQDLTTQDDITLYFEENNFYEGQRAYTLALLKTPTQHPGIMLGVASADITVAENDLPALALNYGGNLEVAEGQGIDVDLELTNGGPEGLHEPLTVRLALTTTSSASTSDIDLPSTVTIPRGMSSATFRITARDDMVDGEIEQFTLALVNASAPSMTELITRAVFRSGGAITVTEAPVPQVTLSLEGDISTIMEGGSVNLIATLAEPLPGGVPEPLTVELAVEGVSDGDYNLPDEIVIPTSGMMETVELTIENDNLAEFAEQLTVSVARLGYGTNRSAPQVESSVGVTIEINNNDMITATILASDLTEAVNAVAVVTIELDRVLPDGLTADEVQLVLVNTVDRADDVSGLPMNIADVFGGDTMALVPLPLMDDMILEGTEVVTLELAVSDRLKPIFANEDTARGSFNINDDEDGTVIIATPVKTAYDESETIELTVKLPSGVSAGAPITVNYAISFPPNVGSTAPAESADITTTSREVMIAANANSVPLTIMLHDDEILEETELLRVTLTGVSTTNGAVVKVGGQHVDLTILDDEDLTYVIEGDATIDEDAGNYTVRLRRTGDIDITLGAMVSYTVSGSGSSNAADGDDFVGGSLPTGSFTFSGYDALSDEVSIAIENDMILENDETFQISVDGGTVTTTKPKEVTIKDDDKASATVQPLSHYVAQTGASETGGKTYLEVALTNAQGGAPAELTIDLMAQATMPSDGGTSSDVKITDESGAEISQVTLATGDTRAIIIIEGRQDNMVEYDETVNIYVSAVNGDDPLDSGFDVTVKSEDRITATLRVLGSSTLTEGQTATAQITLTGPTGGSAMLPFRTSPNALSLVLSDSSDSADVMIPVTDISTGLESMATFDVEISLLDDALLEAVEQIELELRINPGMPDLADVLDVSGASTPFMLSDADSEDVRIAMLSDTSYTEGENVMVTVELPDGPDGLTAGAVITVGYDLIVTTDEANKQEEAEAADIDGSITGEVMIMKGARTAIITINLEDDTIAEETELLGVRLTRASGAMDVGYDGTIVQLKILDNEDPEYTLLGDGMVNESDGAYTVQARRRGRTDVLSVGYTVTVAASDSAQTADFTGGAFPVGTFSFSGDTALSTNTAMIGIEDDALLEDVENFLVLAGGATHPVMLFDNDAPTVFVRYTQAVSTTPSFNEGDSLDLIAELQNAPGGATTELTVTLEVRGISADDTGIPEDVEFPWWSAMTTPTVVIPVGASKVTFAVQAVDDSFAEYTETVNIYVSQVAYGTENRNPGDSGSELMVVSEDPIVAELEVLDSPADLVEGRTARIRVKLNQQLPDRTPAGALSLVLQDGMTQNTYVRIISPDITADLKNGRSTDVMVELTENTCLINVTPQFRLQINSSIMPDLKTLLPGNPSASFDIIDNDPNMVSIVQLGGTEHYEGTTVQFEAKLPETSDGTKITACTPLDTEIEVGGNERVSALGPGFAQGLALPARGFAQVAPIRVQGTIPTGQNSVILTIQLTDDTTPEETELLTVRLTRVSGGATVEIDPQNKEKVITVLDDEPTEYETDGEPSINEETGEYEFRLRRLGLIDRNDPTPVSFRVMGDSQGGESPADESDFMGGVLPSGEVKFDRLGALSDPIVLKIENDDSEEGRKSFRIMLFDSMNMRITLVDPVTRQPLVDSEGMPVTGFAVILLDSDVADFFGGLPPTGGPVLPVWLLLLLALTGIALPLTALRLNR